MPELAEVEAARQQLEACARHRHASDRRSAGLGKTIVSVDTVEDTIVYEGVTNDEVASALTGRKITAVNRHGEQFWLETDTKLALLLHFGMSGHSYVRGSTTPLCAW